MLTIEIAGQKLMYKNAPDLNDKVQELLQEIRSKRTSLEGESKLLRKQEHTLAKFLGGSRKFQSSGTEA
jgi:hypothetical protein